MGTGRVSVVNEKSEPVACIDVAFNIPKATTEEVALKAETQCATASTDHISNIVTDGATTSMDLDEDLNFVDASVDISVQAPIVPAVLCSSIPFPLRSHPPSQLANSHSLTRMWLLPCVPRTSLCLAPSSSVTKMVSNGPVFLWTLLSLLSACRFSFQISAHSCSIRASGL